MVICDVFCDSCCREIYLPSLDMDAEVGGDDCTKISSNIKKLENKLIPENKI